MINGDAIDKIALRLNKLYSLDYDNIDLYKIEEAVNKAVNDVIRRNLKGNNQKREGDEETSFIVDDYAILLTTEKLAPTNKELFAEIVIPENYRYFKRLTPIVKKGNCNNNRIVSVFIEEANVDVYLNDFNSQPSFDFEETFHTELGNTFKVYHNNDFEITSVELTYYKDPDYIKIVNANNSVKWQFKDDLCELIIDEAVKNIAGDTENVSTYQLAEKRIENNN